MTLNRVAKIDGVRINPIQSASDSRGSFFKIYPFSEIKNPLDSVALSFNPITGTVRGLHFQVDPFAEEKLVTCIQGSIFDVIVDLRTNSKTFGKWTSFDLNATNLLQVYLPKGIAHGFQTLAPNTIVHYCLTAEYAPDSSYVIDPFGDLDISWPVDTNNVSDRDKSGLPFSTAAQKYAAAIGFL
jgi:dTDP-4-dehydrorhamnose 3,5-epimerase